MEAPEKIYLTKNLLGELFDGWDALPSDDFISIEYTRTDVFIEKACAFLQDRVEHDSIDYPMATHWLIEDFVKYMKGI